MKTKDFEAALTRGLVAQVKQNPGKCADDNTIAAFLEGRLASSDRSAFESHAANCASCRQVLALAMGIQEKAAGTVVSPASPRSTAARVRWAAVFSAATAVLALGIALLVFRDSQPSRPDGPAAQTAEAVVPAPVAVLPGELRALPAGPAAAGPGITTPTARRDDSRTEAHRTAAAARIAGTNPAVPAETAAAQSTERLPAPPELGDAAVLNPPFPATHTNVQVTSNPPSPPDVGMPAAAGTAREASALPEGEYAARPSEQKSSESDSKRRSMATSMRGPGGMPKDEVISAAEAHEALRRLAREAAAGARPPAGEVAGRRFLSFEGYWIEEECSRHAAEPVLDLEEMSPAAGEIRAALPGLSDLPGGGRRVILRWKDKNRLLYGPSEPRP